MMESDKYTSLFALVDSHLSQTSLKENGTNTKGTLPSPFPKVFNNGSVSESSLLPPNRRLPLPSFGNNDTPISNVLAEQISNMLKAKEKKQKEEEKLKLDEEMKKLKVEDDNYVIDLVKAIRAPCDSSPPSQPELHKSGSFESLFKLDLSDSNGDDNSRSYLPCITDMSYMLKKKIKKGKCSPFGRVLISRLKPVAAPYLKEIIKSDIVPFDFSTKSPCDLIKEKLRKPTSYSIQNFNMVAEFMMCHQFSDSEEESP